MSKNETARGAGQLLIDLGPIIAFVVSFNVLRGSHPEDAIFIATGVFILATLVAVAYAWFRTRSVPPVLIVTAVLVVGFGGLTLLLHDEGFMKIKPTVVNLFYAVAIFGSMLFGHNVWRLLFRHAFTLPDRVWNILAVRWGVFFVFMAILNEAIWRTQSTDFWVNSRLFITFPLVMIFAAINIPITMKYAGRTSMEEPAAEPAAEREGAPQS